MKIKYKKTLENAVAPFQAHKGDACFDLTVAKSTMTQVNNLITGVGADGETHDLTASTEWEQHIDSGLAFEIPEGHVGLLFMRSSAVKKDNNYNLKNAVGVIDATYRGSVTAVFKCPDVYYVSRDNINGRGHYKLGERFAQLLIVPIPTVEYEEVKELTGSVRGKKGYGSSGK